MHISFKSEHASAVLHVVQNWVLQEELELKHEVPQEQVESKLMQLDCELHDEHEFPLQYELVLRQKDEEIFHMHNSLKSKHASAELHVEQDWSLQNELELKHEVPQEQVESKLMQLVCEVHKEHKFPMQYELEL